MHLSSQVYKISHMKNTLTSIQEYFKVRDATGRHVYLKRKKEEQVYSKKLSLQLIRWIL